MVMKNKAVVTRKSHRCEWCDEVICAGEPAQYRVYICDGEFCHGWQHPECYQAMLKTDRNILTNGWLPGSFKRGKVETEL